MHVLVLVVGDDVHKQLKAQYPKRIDFHIIGGRWSGHLPRRGPDGKIEDVDSLRAGELAWDQALAKTEAAARKAFAEWMQIVERHGRPKSREEIADELGLERNPYGDYPDEVYDRYREQPAMQAYDEAHRDDLSCPIYRFGFDEEQYVAECVARRITPFALVIDGKWLGGKPNLDKADFEWAGAVRDRLRSLPPDTRITVADCHC